MKEFYRKHPLLVNLGAILGLLTLLAVFLQHTDSKPEQQRILCRDQASSASRESCGRPFLMISDVGLTFGRANATNSDELGGVNLVAC